VLSRGLLPFRPGSASANRLFHQTPDGRFIDVSAGSGLDVSGHCTGMADADPADARELPGRLQPR
jgi:hypothetical protein